MSKKTLTILSITMVLVIAGMVFLPHMSYAAESGIITTIAKGAVNTLLANIGNVILTFTAMLLTIAGTFLSVSINITTHLKDIYDSIPAIKAVWVTIRNISSIFIIFSLLYFSIGTILGVGSGFNKIVVKVFLAGILINFSLFFFKLAIDASNIISLQFYRAIAPNTEQNWSVGQAFTDGGLSNIFLQSLKIQKIYNNSGVLKAPDASLGISFAVYGGVILMAVAFLSLFAAAIAFTARTAILLFCLAMSPLYFVGIIFPEIKKKVSDKIIGLLYSQCVFMPVYLFLLYISLKIISDPNFNAIFNDKVGGTDPGGFGPVWIGVIIQYTIAIFFINLPLVAAIDLGGKGMSWAPQAGAIGKWMTGGYGKKPASFAGQHIIGRGAKFASDKIASSDWAKTNPNLAVYADKQLGKVSSSSFFGTKGGYDARVKSYAEARSKFATKKLGLSALDKGGIDLQVTNDLNADLTAWDAETRRMEGDVARIMQEYKDAVSTSGKTSPLALKKRAELDAARARMTTRGVDARNSYQEQRRKTLKEDKEKDQKKKNTEAYAVSLEQDNNPVTRAASKKAAEEIRKTYKKAKGKKLLEDVLEDMSKDGDSDKGEGGDKK